MNRVGQTATDKETQEERNEVRAGLGDSLGRLRLPHLSGQLFSPISLEVGREFASLVLNALTLIGPS